MAFNSLEYAIFLIAVFLVFWGLARFGLGRLVFLCVASYVFYASSNPWFLALLFGSTLIDFGIGLALERDTRKRTALGLGRPSPDAPPSRYRRAVLIASVVVNLGILAVFKYTNFFFESGVALGNLFGADLVFTRLDIILPAGISFYTFQALSYTIDVYRCQIRAERNLLRFAFFVGFFPQLIMGPIMRAGDLLPQIDKRPFLSRQQASRALWLIAIGLFKKICIADVLSGDIVDRVWADPARVSSADVLIGLYAYTMQTYMDFSAYMDIAIGSALLFGYHLPDNFDRPYMAISIQDFWRRWHKTLGSWLRDYLYYPLGGGKGSDLRVYFNLFLTFLLIGFWHGANINFLLYGVGHATAMCVHRWFRKRRERHGGAKHQDLTAWGLVWRIFLTLHFVVFMRILFRSADPDYSSEQAFDVAGAITSRLFDDAWGAVTVLSPTLAILLIGSYLVHWSPRRWVEATYVAFARLHPVWQGIVFTTAVMIMIHALSGRPRPFDYFQF